MKADGQPLQAHLRNKSAKEPYAEESGTARGSVNSATGCEIKIAAEPHERKAKKLIQVKQHIHGREEVQYFS